MEEDKNAHKLKDCFELQLSEIEMLSSMYPNSSEFNVTLPSVLADMTSYVAGNTDSLPNELDFTWSMDIPDINVKLEVNVTLPHDYPESKPFVSARSVGLNRRQQKELNENLFSYLLTLPNEELCSISMVNWLTENAPNYFTLQPQTEESDVTIPDELACRMWMYSHHIYSKFKRREIIDSAQDLKLMGFSLPGKPGFICFEGSKRDCNDFLQQLKNMSWKKISLVKEETEKLDKGSSLSDFRKFKDFREISFQVRRGAAKEYHMDMGQFFKFLEEHMCGYAFHDFFGLEGHTSEDK